MLGGKGRVHVFTQQAKHITSVMMQGSAIERRRHMGRWRLAEPEEHSIRIHCKRLIASGQDATEEDVLPQAVAKASVADAPAGGAASSNKPSRGWTPESRMRPKIGIVTISDRASLGVYADESGPAIEAVLRGSLATKC